MAIIQDGIANDYLAQYNLNLGVSAVEKINSFSYLQKLTYNGILNYLKEDFLGLDDWAIQIQLYSSANSLLRTPYQAIQNLIPLNTQVAEDIIYIESLGFVGNVFESITGYSTVFSLNGSQLTDSSSASTSATSIS